MAVENLTTWTEVDSHSDLTVASDEVTIEGMNLNAVSHVTKDIGEDAINDVNVEFAFKFRSTGDAGAVCIVMGLMAAASTRADMDSDDVNAYFYNAGGEYRLYIDQGYNSYDDYTVISADTWYYGLLERAAGGTTVSLKVYTDEARTNLFDTISVSVDTADRWRYYETAGSNGASAGPEMDANIKDVDLNIGTDNLVASLMW